MKQPRLFIRSTAISALLADNSHVGGIAVQLYFWSQCFSDKGWQVFSLSSSATHVKQRVHFIRYRNWGALDLIHEWMNTFWVYLRHHPSLVMVRGAGRSLYPVAKLAQLFHIPVVFFGASDVNFQPGKELITGNPRNRQLYQKAIPYVTHFVVQNKFQLQTLRQHYNHQALILPNIWGNTPTYNHTSSPTDVIWVANLRSLKRPEWILHAAEALPQVRFTMVGGADSKEKDYYNTIKTAAEKLSNITFLGSRTFTETCQLVGDAKVLACTSEFEGFPNTFLQAWHKSKPVISTVNPNDIITTHHLGLVVDNEQQFIDSIRQLVVNNEHVKYYHDIEQYFISHYNIDNQFNQLIQFLGLNGDLDYSKSSTQ